MSKTCHASVTALGLVAALAVGSPGIARADTAPMVAPPIGPGEPALPKYRVGAGDSLQIWVWKNPDLTAEVPVRPDGKVSIPLIPDVQAQGQTSTEIAAELRQKLSQFIQDPVVAVLVKSFSPTNNDAAIRVIGAAATPKSVSYRAGITALDVVIEAGGLSIYADGDGAKLIRKATGGYVTYPLHLKRLVKAGDLGSNIELMPGDIIRIPERWF